MGSPQYCAGRIALLREYCAAIGRDVSTIELSVHPQLAIGRSYDEAEAKARAIAQSHGQNLDDERGKWLLGTPDEIRAQVQRYIDVGITHWIMAMGAPFDLDALRLFADEVMVAFR